jgi:aminoglycoside phosphotransferase (APT) family kinase protein
MDWMQEMLPRVEAYLSARSWRDVPVMSGQSFRVTPLAQGEYNLNFLLSSDETRLVLRVNIGTQIEREDQIVYEYESLRLLESSGVTPIPYFVDDTRAHLDHGILVMAYLPGEPLDYERHLEAAADLLAVVHQVPVAEEENHLIREDAPLSLIFEECAGLLETYFGSPLADPDIKEYLGVVKIWADAARVQERFFREDPWPCIVNTEVNSGNFIVNLEQQTIHLVDWEMPRYGDPSQDLCHFCSPLTTLWKTRYRMTERDKRAFIRSYASGHRDRHLRDTIGDRIQVRDPFVYLRGICWSAMAWAAYQTDFDGVRNPDTWATLQRYMDLEFIRSLFDPFMARWRG